MTLLKVKGIQDLGPSLESSEVLGGTWQPCLQTLPQIAHGISLSTDIQGRSKGGKKNRKSYKWNPLARLTWDPVLLNEVVSLCLAQHWDPLLLNEVVSLCLPQHRYFGPSVYNSLPSSGSISLPFLSFISFLLSSSHPFSLFLLKGRVGIKHSNFLMPELEKEKKGFICALFHCTS